MVGLLLEILVYLKSALLYHTMEKDSRTLSKETPIQLHFICSDFSNSVHYFESYFKMSASNIDGKALAECLRENGAKLYGTSWCGYCSRQLDYFGPEGRELIEYVDCSKKSGQRGFDEECLNLGIRVVPSWGLADGTIVPGTQQLGSLAKATGCERIFKN